MKNKLIISHIMICTLVITSIGVVIIDKDTQIYNTGAIACIMGQEITRKQMNIIKSEYKNEQQYATLIGRKIKAPCDDDLIRGLTKIKVREQLVLQYKIVLSDKEKDKVSANVADTMKIFKEMLISDSPKEREIGRQIFDGMKKSAQVRGLTMEQYINEVYNKQIELGAKLDKLIKNSFLDMGIFLSHKELDKCIDRTVEKNLIVFKHDIG